MMALRCLLGRTLEPSLGFCRSRGVTARNCSLKAGDRLREWDFRSTFNPGSPVFEDFPSLKDFADRNAKLEFVRVLRGYVEVGLPTKFILILEAIDAGMKKKCRAEILQDASNNYDMVLQSFEIVSSSPGT